MKRIESRLSQLEQREAVSDKVYMWRDSNETDEQFANKVNTRLAAQNLPSTTEVMQFCWQREAASKNDNPPQGE